MTRASSAGQIAALRKTITRLQAENESLRRNSQSTNEEGSSVEANSQPPVVDALSAGGIPGISLYLPQHSFFFFFFFFFLTSLNGNLLTLLQPVMYVRHG